jgi:hypothetical protein
MRCISYPSHYRVSIPPKLNWTLMWTVCRYCNGLDLPDHVFENSSILRLQELTAELVKLYVLILTLHLYHCWLARGQTTYILICANTWVLRNFSNVRVDENNHPRSRQEMTITSSNFSAEMACRNRKHTISQGMLSWNDITSGMRRYPRCRIGVKESTCKSKRTSVGARTSYLQTWTGGMDVLPPC